MGLLDERDASQPRSPSFNMLDRGVGAARRKVMLLILLGGFLIISLVAFRRQDQIGDIIETQRHSWHNTTASYTETDESLVEKPSRLAPEEKTGSEDEKDVEEDSKDSYRKPSIIASISSKSSKAKEDAKKALTDKHPIAPGPRLGDRKLSDSSLVDVRNETLGVRSSMTIHPDGQTDNDI